MPTSDQTKFDMANRLFFRLYQCANMLHKTGSRAIEAEGLTTQQWAVLGALSREQAQGGIGIGDLARYLMVSRENLSGLIRRMERDGHVTVATSGQDRRSRVVTITDSGRYVWQHLALPNGLGSVSAHFQKAGLVWGIGGNGAHAAIIEHARTLLRNV